MTYLHRESPTILCDTVLTKEEWQVLYCYNFKQTILPQIPPTLRDAIIWIAKIGGFLARKNDGFPGAKVIWRGYRRLVDLTEGYMLFQLGRCG